MSQKPTIGRVVHYKLSEQDAAHINKRRADFDKARYADKRPEVEDTGFQAHHGNHAEAGQVFPALVVRVWSGNGVNLQVFLDGNDTFWATSAAEGDGERQWSWPPRA